MNFALAQSTALPPPPAPGAGHSVSALSIVLVVLVVLGSAAMVSLSSRRFKRRSAEKPAESPQHANSSSDSGRGTSEPAERLDSELLSRLRRVTDMPVERRRLGDRRPKASSDVDEQAENAAAPAEPAPTHELIGHAPAAMLADDEPRFPEPIPIHRRSSRAVISDQATSRGRAWPGSSQRASIPGLSEEELRVLEPSRTDSRAASGGESRLWPATRGFAAHDEDLALANELSGVVRELLFCANSGQLLHGFSLYSDAFLFRTMDDSGMNEEEFKTAHQHVPAKPIRDWTRLAELRDIERHADNVVTATVVYTPPAGVAEIPRERFRFLKSDETNAWMIDDIEPID